MPEDKTAGTGTGTGLAAADGTGEAVAAEVGDGTGGAVAAGVEHPATPTTAATARAAAPVRTRDGVLRARRLSMRAGK